MEKRAILLLLVLTTFVVAPAIGALPGVRVDVSEDGLQHVVDTLLPTLEAQLLHSTIPTVQGDVHVPLVGKIAYTLSDIKLSRLSTAGARVALGGGSSSASLGLSITGLAADVTLRWHYREHNWPHVSDSGTAHAATAKATAAVTVVIGADAATGRPTAAVSACSLDLGKLTLTLHGGASWLYDIFINVFHDHIVKAIDSGVCTELHSTGNAMIAEILASMPVKEPIGGGMGVDYALTASPVHIDAPSRLSVPSLGEVYPLSEGPGHAPFTPVALPLATTKRWIEIGVSQFSIDTAGFSAWHAGALKLQVTKDMAPAAAATFFCTSFYKTYAPGLWTRFGKADVALGISVESMPGFVVNTEGFIATFPVTLRISAFNASTSVYDEAFAVLAKTLCEGELELGTNASIVGELTVLNATTSLVSTDVGDINVDGMDELVAFALGMGQDLVNAYLVTGIALPLPSGLTIVNGEVHWYAGFLSVAADFKYTPPARVLAAAATRRSG